MSFQLQISPGDTIDNSKLCSIFKCSTQGGMRRSKATNTLVIISKHVNVVYGDAWKGDVLHYTGMGLEGNQSLKEKQNKTLAESGKNGVAVHLFEVFKKGEYTYFGKVELAGSPYQEKQPDQSGRARTVWMFPLKRESGGHVHIPENTFLTMRETNERAAKKVDSNILLERAQRSNPKPTERLVVVKQYERSPYIAELARRSAKGICALCKSPAPFQTNDGEPFLEVHHINWLSQDGEDSIENTVAICPNCHRRLHHLKNEKDIEALRQYASSAYLKK